MKKNYPSFRKALKDSKLSIKEFSAEVDIPAQRIYRHLAEKKELRLPDGKKVVEYFKGKLTLDDIYYTDR